MFSGSDDGTILGWGCSVPPGLTKLASEPAVLMKGHKDGILKTQWSRGVLYTASYDASVKLWDSYEVSRILNPDFIGKAVCLHIDEFGASAGCDIPIEELPSQIKAAKFEKARRYALSRNKSIVADFGIRVKTSGWSQKPGIIIDELVTGGPAYECGLKPRDSISTINDVQATSVSAIEYVLENMKHGSKSCSIQIIKSIESITSHGSLTATETTQILHDHELKFGLAIQPQYDSSLSWLHILTYCPVAISGTASINDQVNAITELFSGMPDVFSALFTRFGLTWKKQQTSGALAAPFLTSSELCEFLIASKLVKPHCGLAGLAELFSESVVDAKGNWQQPVPFWHTKYVHYAIFIMIGILRLACIKYSKKLTSISARLSHLVDKHVRPSFARSEQGSALTLSHHAIVAQEDVYGDLSIFLSNSEKQLLGRGESHIDSVGSNASTFASENLRFAVENICLLLCSFFCRLRKDFQELFTENAEFLEGLFCSSLAPRGQMASWRTPCAMDVSLFLQKRMPEKLAKTIYTLPRPGTTKGVSGTELFGEEWAEQLVSQCLLPQDVSLALDSPLRKPLSASIGRRTTVIPGKLICK
jgi:hypothetical protein